MRFNLPDFCVEDLPSDCKVIREQHNFRKTVPVEKCNGNKIETVNGLKVKSINLFAAHCHDPGSPFAGAPDATIAFFEIETEDPVAENQPTHQIKL